MANSLEFNVIPKLDKTVSFISDVLEEQEREDMFRIKIFKKSEAVKLTKKQQAASLKEQEIVQTISQINIS